MFHEVHGCFIHLVSLWPTLSGQNWRKTQSIAGDVPQVSTMSPFLINLYSSYIPRYTWLELSFYADDIAVINLNGIISIVIITPEDHLRFLQSCMEVTSQVPRGSLIPKGTLQIPWFLKNREILKGQPQHSFEGGNCFQTGLQYQIVVYDPNHTFHIFSV